MVPRGELNMSLEELNMMWDLNLKKMNRYLDFPCCLWSQGHLWHQTSSIHFMSQRETGNFVWHQVVMTADNKKRHICQSDKSRFVSRQRLLGHLPQVIRFHNNHCWDGSNEILQRSVTNLINTWAFAETHTLTHLTRSSAPQLWHPLSDSGLQARRPVGGPHWAVKCRQRNRERRLSREEAADANACGGPTGLSVST